MHPQDSCFRRLTTRNTASAAADCRTSCCAATEGELEEHVARLPVTRRCHGKQLRSGHNLLRLRHPSKNAGAVSEYPTMHPLPAKCSAKCPAANTVNTVLLYTTTYQALPLSLFYKTESLTILHPCIPILISGFIGFTKVERMSTTRAPNILRTF